ncbi:hypothetical protein AKJ51_01485 [candidate division MSBL1 archaeon SCGC-AAA382A20]|uniref:Uncharacterized protein n=1 Tax=candidate division MSBL1 archaeon SCGC-AAA382A20 TaxID=1698280 RepID=A0A133VLV3_9EURY|nr:hypothetical protein AKJ51_01485 [candidate division MSBL1 archaeon SCGC-AAA382A20]
MTWYIYKDGSLRNRIRITYDVTKPEIANLLAESSDREGKKEFLLEPDNPNSEWGSKSWTKSEIDEYIREHLEIAGENAPRTFDADYHRYGDEIYKNCLEVANKYYENVWQKFRINFSLSPREIALLISDEIDDKDKITKKYVDEKIRQELEYGGIHQGWYGIGDYVDEETVNKAEKMVTELYNLDEFRKQYGHEPKFQSKGRGRGWHGQPARHSMARRKGL